MKTHTIFASKLAAVAGLHKYQDLDQALLDQWYFADPCGCASACRRDGVKLQTPAPVQQELYASKMQSAMDAGDSRALSAVLDAIDDPIVQEAVRQDASRARGTRDEAVALDSIESAHGIRVVARNDQLYRKDVLLPSGRTLKVIGRIDGREDGSDQIVEVKNRMRRFFDIVPLYEKIQVQLYLWLTGASSCLFVERLDGKAKETTIACDYTFLETLVWPEVDSSLDILDRVLAGDAKEQASLLLTGRLPEKYVPR